MDEGGGPSRAPGISGSVRVFRRIGQRAGRRVPRLAATTAPRRAESFWRRNRGRVDYGAFGFFDTPRHRQGAFAPAHAEHQDLMTVRQLALVKDQRDRISGFGCARQDVDGERVHDGVVADAFASRNRETHRSPMSKQSDSRGNPAASSRDWHCAHAIVMTFNVGYGF